MMSEILLQTVIEKLQHIESVQMKQDAVTTEASQHTLLSKIEAMEKELKVYASGVKISNDNLTRVSLKWG